MNDVTNECVPLSCAPQVMIIGAGIGMTPCASVLTAMLRYRWRFGQTPEKLHFYLVVQHGEVTATPSRGQASLSFCTAVAPLKIVVFFVHPKEFFPS